LLSTGSELVSIALAYLISGGKMPAPPTVEPATDAGQAG
jgi:hypothetical protein